MAVEAESFVCFCSVCLCYLYVDLLQNEMFQFISMLLFRNKLKLKLTFFLGYYCVSFSW